MEAWHGVDFRHLAALEAIASEGSFSAAGVRTGYSQSAISGQIATLERVVGARLISRLRGSRSVKLTPEGERLLEHAKVINARLAAARADLEAMRGEGRPVLRVGTFQSVSQTLLPPLLTQLAVQPTPIATALHEDPVTENLVQLLLAGELDVAFVVLPVPDDEIETVELVRDPWTVVVRSDHSLARLDRPVRAADISGLPLVTFARSRAQSFVEGALLASGMRANVVSRLADSRSVLSLVSAGLGCGLLPQLAIEADLEEPTDLRMLPIEDLPRRLIGLAWNRERALDDAASRFVALATCDGQSLAA